MRAKIFIVGFICLYLFSCEGIENSYSPELPPTDESYSCKIELTVSHSNTANGCFYLFLDDKPLGSSKNLNFSPLPNNPDISEGTFSFWKFIPLGTHLLTLRLAHYNDLEPGQITPGAWNTRMIVSSRLELLIGGGVQEQKIGIWKVEQDYYFTFITAN